MTPFEIFVRKQAEEKGHTWKDVENYFATDWIDLVQQFQLEHKKVVAGVLNEIIEFVEHLGEMGWYMEKDNGTWHHDDEIGSFNNTTDLVNHYYNSETQQPTLEAISAMASEETGKRGFNTTFFCQYEIDTAKSEFPEKCGTQCTDCKAKDKQTQPISIEAIEKMAEKEYPYGEGNSKKEYGLIDLERKCFIKGFTSALGYSASDNWISVDERLPEKDEYGGYLVLFDNIHGEQMQCVASFQGVPRHAFQNPPIDKRWFVFPSSGHEIKPTHWQPLPKPPIKKQ